MIYLDSAATSLLKPESVSYAVSRALWQMASPGRGAYAPAMLAADTVFRCRESAAELFHVDSPDQVVFTMNATHALNMAIFSLGKPGSRVVISGFEHNSVTRPLHALGAKIRVAGRKLFAPEDTLAQFQKLLPGADYAVCTYVSNAFGYILPIGEIAALCRREGVPLVIDASQAAGILDLDMQKLGAAFAAMPGHKGLMGPQGTGILLCAVDTKPLLHGGSGSDSRLQEMPNYLPDQLEAGTQNVCGIAGLLAGIEYVKRVGTKEIFAREEAFLEQSIEILRGSGWELYAAGNGTQSGVLSLRSGHMDPEQAAEKLSSEGICVRAGLHCAPLAHESAGTLETGTLRMSFSPLLTESDIAEACAIIRRLR